MTCVHYHFVKKKAGNVLFNDAFNTFYLVIWCYTGDSQRGIPLLPLFGLLFVISSNKSFILQKIAQKCQGLICIVFHSMYFV